MGALFRCSAEAAGQISSRARERTYPPPVVIVRQGEPPTETFIVVTGRARAQVYAADGQEVFLYEYASGDIFGALASLDTEPNDAEIRAVETVGAGVFSGVDFLTLAERHACVPLTVTRVLRNQLRQTVEQMVGRATLSSSGRVCAELLRRARRCGDGRFIEPIPVNAELAVLVYTTRETVSRTVSTLERRGVLRREAHRLVVLAPHRLEEMVF